MDTSKWSRRTLLIVVIIVVILAIFIVLGLLIVRPVSAPASVCTLYRAQISKDMQEINLLHKQGLSAQVSDHPPLSAAFFQIKIMACFNKAYVRM